MKNLRGRIERLEKAAGGGFQAKLQALLARLLSSNMQGIDRFVEVASQHEALLSRHIGDDGSITWEGFCRLIDLGAFGREAGD